VERSGEHDLAAIAAELERYWSEQWRRAKEICDLLEQRLGRATAKPDLYLVGSSHQAPEPDETDGSRPELKLVDR